VTAMFVAMWAEDATLGVDGSGESSFQDILCFSI